MSIITEFPIFDDVGSFPLPDYIDKDNFNKFYWSAYQGILNKADISQNRGIKNFVIQPIIDSFIQKVNAGVEVINFPQHMDIYTQFLKPLNDHEIEPGLISKDAANIIEVPILAEYAKEQYEQTGRKLQLKICITGPIELYVKERDFTIYLDLALNYAKTIKHFIKNSLIDTKYMKTALVSIDEPSFGYIDIVNVNNEEVAQIFDKCLEGVSIDSQIHLHTLARAKNAMQSEHLDVLTCEYASDPSNVIPKAELEEFDKFIRVGITRTNINSIISEALDAGKTYEELNTFKGTLQLIDSKDRIEKNLREALKRYGDRLKYVGPDCGLSGWSPPEAAYELLHRTFEIIEKVKKEK